MKQYLGTIEKTEIDELMKISRRLKALKDLKSTLTDSAVDRSVIELSSIGLEDVGREISELTEKKSGKIEGIRINHGWSEEEMSRIHLMENTKVYMDGDSAK